uniref:Trematode Eggshell Synthesis domain containing protein n=1 Tax=Schistosoma haematobium TaxID=6185 RepID=A0A095A4Y3_SCHHA
MCLLFAIILYSLLCVKVNSQGKIVNRTSEIREFRNSKQDNDHREMVTRDNTTKHSREKNEDSHSSTSGDFGFQSSQRKFQLKYSNRKRSDIYTTGYQTFLGKRRRGSKSHVKTIFRKRSGYDRNGQKKRTTTFESYGEADSFDRKKIRDVFDVNGYISEGRRRSKLGGYIQEEQHAFMSGGHKSQASRNSRKSSEDGSHTESDTRDQSSTAQHLEGIHRFAKSTPP